MKRYDNEHFYKADGTFDADVAKQAYYEMMEHHGYPIPDRLRSDEFWVADFGVGCYREIGMAGIFWMNRLEDNYFGHEIFLLPGQMIPEHKHVRTEAAGPKMEGWHVRHGHIYTYSEGKGSEEDEARIPASHTEYANSRTAVKLMPGETNYLAGAEQWHYMLAGPEGAIVTEYATYHDGDGLRFSHPKVVF
ncbi:MAG: hypothetical protein GY851_19000 [bacterium]|nr:hypothetical protein [bacterium]